MYQQCMFSCSELIYNNYISKTFRKLIMTRWYYHVSCEAVYDDVDTNARRHTVSYDVYDVDINARFTKLLVNTKSNR